MQLLLDILLASWDTLASSAVYILFGILVAGLLRVFLNPAAVAGHLGTGRFLSVFKAALLGIPIPLCSCGVVPAAASLKRQGANNGATAAFLIATPESGADSIAITYALLDPIMTVARPSAAFLTAAAAGIAENTLAPGDTNAPPQVPDLSCPVDGCCDGIHCDPEVHRKHHSLQEKLRAGMRFAFQDLWPDLASWFLVGMLLAGIIQVALPTELLTRHLGGGLGSMIIMLVIGIPLYICATASTPIAASLILKGVSPGAALVFLLAGPATNAASLTMLLRVLGKRATAVYLASIALLSVLLGLALDAGYAITGISAQASVGRAAELIPEWARISGAAVLLVLSAGPAAASFRRLFRRITGRAPSAPSCAYGNAHGEPLPMHPAPWNDHKNGLSSAPHSEGKEPQ